MLVSLVFWGHPQPSVTDYWVISQEPHWGLGFPCSQGCGICWHQCWVQTSVEGGRQEDGRAFGKPPSLLVGEALTLVLWVSLHMAHSLVPTPRT